MDILLKSMQFADPEMIKKKVDLRIIALALVMALIPLHIVSMDKLNELEIFWIKGLQSYV